MSIEQLKSDTAEVVKALPSGPLTSAADVAAYMKNNFLPLFGDLVTELEEMDATIADLVSGAPDILHQESATLFLALIEGAAKIIAELRGKLSQHGIEIEPPIAKAMKEWDDLATDGRRTLEEVTFIDPDEDPDPAGDQDDDDDQEDPDDEESPKDPGK